MCVYIYTHTHSPSRGQSLKGFSIAAQDRRPGNGPRVIIIISSSIIIIVNISYYD